MENGQLMNIGMKPSEVVSFFGDELTNAEIDSIYENLDSSSNVPYHERLFDFSKDNLIEDEKEK